VLNDEIDALLFDPYIKSTNMKLFKERTLAPRFVEKGSGVPIILLYGLFGSVNTFTPLIKHLEKQYRVIVPVFPFFESGYTIDIFSLTDFVEEIVQELELPHFHLLGNSMGGHIALLYTLKHPEKVSSLILSGSSGLYENGMGDSFPRRKDYDYIKTKTALTFYDPSIATKELVDEIYSTVNSLRVIQIISLAKSTIRNNLEKQLPAIATDCCLIWGREDSITPAPVARQFQQHIAGARLFWIEQCGHVPMLEKPDQFNTILDSFFLSLYQKNTVAMHPSLTPINNPTPF
jgi:2-hydroxy-6-oxonona-2,4-dienedioate hydrolase